MPAKTDLACQRWIRHVAGRTFDMVMPLPPFIIMIIL